MRFPLFLSALILVLFFAFNSRLPNYFIPSVRQSSLTNLITATQANKHLDPQQYWETREFYYPGVFYVYQDGLTQAHIQQFRAGSQILLHDDIPTFPILVYTAKPWHSYEALVRTNNLEEIVDIPQGDTLYSDSQTLITRYGKTTYIFFVKPYEELKVTNGFIYTKDQILKDYNYWFGVSVITE